MPNAGVPLGKQVIVIGVLALQGDFAEHLVVLHRLGVEGREVRMPSDLIGVAGLIIPGGESTTISRLMDQWGMREPITRLAGNGMPIWGTCAGLILTAKHIVDDPIVSLGLLDVDVQRNAYGSQIDSFETFLAFETPLGIEAFGKAPMPAVFIRAPVIRRVGPSVAVLARTSDGTPVAVKQGNLLGSSFHPELTPDTRFHVHLVNLAKEHVRVSNVEGL